MEVVVVRRATNPADFRFAMFFCELKLSKYDVMELFEVNHFPAHIFTEYLLAQHFNWNLSQCIF